MAESLKNLVFNRGHVRRKLTLLHKDVTDNLESLTNAQKLTSLNKVKSLLDELKELDKKVLLLKWDEQDKDNETKQQEEMDNCSQYEEKAYEAMGVLEHSLQVPIQTPGFETVPVAHPGKLKAPTAPLPTYGGTDKENLDKFFLNFEAIINHYAYSNYEKFILLRGQTSGRARTLIDSLESNKQSYEEAKQLLQQALASPLKQAYDSIQRLLDLKLTYQQDPFEFVSEIKLIRELFRSLKIDVDTILQYGIWRGMNETLQNQFILITNKNKPSLEDIESHMFDAIERYQAVTKKYKVRKQGNGNSQKKTTNFALNVKPIQKRESFCACSLCSTKDKESDHPLYKCPQYKTSNEKLKRIRQLNGCDKCGYINHRGKDCKLSYLVCKNCSRDHFTFLCPKQTVKTGNPLAKPTQQTTNNVVWATKTMTLASREGAALQTFTCNIKGQTIRGMKDSGCETTLILDTIAQELELEIVEENLPLVINGFNSSKNLATSMVKVPMSFGNKVYEVPAITVPAISVTLNLPKLGIVASKLMECGYALADKLITESSKGISDIGLILGTDHSYLLPINTIVFGKRTPRRWLAHRTG